jgi:Transketolase, N-terminal subunit
VEPARPSDTELRIAADQLRLDSLRGLAGPGSGHAGGILSMAELLAVLYNCFVRTDPAEPKKPERDKVVLSKGHCGPGLFAALAARGFFPASELTSINKNGTRFPSHCDMNKTPGVDMTTGSLGQGASTAAGLALADTLAGRDFTTYLILGDGELDEGQVWEMALFAAQQKLDNLIAFVDANGQQLDGDVNGICGLGDIAAKFRSFGWNTLSIDDGHDVTAIRGAIIVALATKGMPTAIVLNTVKGKCWTQLEGKCPVHHSVVTAEMLAQAEEEIGGRIAEMKKQLEISAHSGKQ